jgi:DNA polymerase elongation subunit (family B)
VSDKKKQAKILLFDIETSPNVGYVWGKYDQNVIDYKSEWELLCFAYKWYGEKEIKCIARPDFKDKTDKSITKALWKLIDEADILIAHNGDEFDIKKATAKFIEHGLVPPRPSRSVDTKKVAKRYFKFNSNKLDDLGKLLGVGRKVKTGGFDLWLGCMAGKKSSWRDMIKYNKQDIALLERVYNKLLPWTDNHPNVSHIAGRPDGCPKCGSARLKSHGFRKTQTAVYVRYRCVDCNGFCRGRVAEKLEKPKYANI